MNKPYNKEIQRMIERDNYEAYSVLVYNYTEAYMRFLIPALLNEHITNVLEIYDYLDGDFRRDYLCKNKFFTFIDGELRCLNDE